VLQEGERDQCHQCVPVKSCPGALLEVVEAEFLLHLLMRLLARALMAAASAVKSISAGKLER
jgi:hypothetical protein